MTLLFSICLLCLCAVVCFVSTIFKSTQYFCWSTTLINFFSNWMGWKECGTQSHRLDDAYYFVATYNVELWCPSKLRFFLLLTISISLFGVVLYNPKSIAISWSVSHQLAFINFKSKHNDWSIERGRIQNTTVKDFNLIVQRIKISTTKNNLANREKKLWYSGIIFLIGIIRLCMWRFVLFILFPSISLPQSGAQNFENALKTTKHSNGLSPIWIILHISWSLCYF